MFHYLPQLFSNCVCLVFRVSRWAAVGSFVRLKLTKERSKLTLNNGYMCHHDFFSPFISMKFNKALFLSYFRIFSCNPWCLDTSASFILLCPAVIVNGLNSSRPHDSTMDSPLLLSTFCGASGHDGKVHKKMSVSMYLRVTWCLFYSFLQSTPSNSSP